MTHARTLLSAHLRDGLLAALALLPTAAAAQSNPPPAPAPAPIGLEASGYGFTRFERYSGYNNFAGVPADLSADAVRYRFMLGLQTTPIALTDSYKLVFRVTPQLGGFWHIGGDTLDDPTLVVHEGLMRLVGPHWRLEAGRLELSYGDELVLGSVRWHHIGRAFDGARLRLEPFGDGAFLDVLATQLSEGTIDVAAGTGQTGDALGAGDRYLLGLYAGLGPRIRQGLELDVYALDLRVPAYSYTVEDVTTTVEGGDELTLGVRTKGKAGALDWRLEAGVQLGSRAVADTRMDALGMQADAEAGVTLNVLKGIRLGLEGFYASGDDPGTTDRNEAWDPLFPTAHKWLGLMDYVDKKGGRSNIMGGAGHVKLGILEPLAATIDVHQFVRPEEAAEGQASGGLEIDSGLTYAVGKNLAFRGALDFFFKNETDAALSDTDEDLLRFVELEMAARF